jgi:hypothetical protein
MSDTALSVGFVAPDDEEYLSLKAEYAFNDQALRKQFLDSGVAITRDSQMLAKQHNLILFRELCDRSVTLPGLLFSFSPGNFDIQRLSQSLKMVVAWTSGAADYDLGSELSQLYAGVPWIVDYFVTCTFPGAFGHFLSHEYLTYGLNFIKSHINDALAPRLVGTFLLHCFLFRDRLLQNFVERISERRLDMTACFLRAFAQSISYFSDSHIQAVKHLRAVSDALAVEAVFTYFLVPVVKQWSFSPMLQLTNAIQVRRRRALLYKSMTYHQRLLSEIERLKSDSAGSLSILSLFDGEVGTDYPAITKIVIYGGLIFPRSIVDICLIQQLGELVKRLTQSRLRPRRVEVNVATAIQDAFALHTTIRHVLPATVEEPTRTETSPHLTRRKLEEHRELHNFLFSLSGGLRRFDIILSAQRNVNRLCHRAFAHRLFLGENGTVQPAQFARFQRSSYAIAYFDQFMNPALQDFIRSNSERPGVTTGILDGRIVVNITEGKSPAVAIVNAALDHATFWKGEFNKRSREGQPMCLVPEEDYIYCEFFTNEVDAIAFELVMQQLSAWPYAISPARSGTPAELRAALVQVLGPPLLTHSFEEAMAHELVKFIVGVHAPLKFLVASAEAAGDAALEKGEWRFALGDWAVLFLEVERIMWPILASETIAFEMSIDTTWLKRFLSALFEGKEPIHFRGWLRQVLMAIAYLDGTNPVITELDTIGNPINAEVLQRFDRLREWFGFPAEILQRQARVASAK